MDVESLLQEKITSKQLAKLAKSEDRRVKITADKITAPTVLGSGTVASMLNASGDEKVITAAAKGVKETVAQVKSGNLEELEAILVNQSKNSLKHGMRSKQAIVASQEAQDYLKQARELIKQVQQNLEKWHA